MKAAVNMGEEPEEVEESQEAAESSATSRPPPVQMRQGGRQTKAEKAKARSEA